MIITQKSPKKFRFTFVGRLQNLSLSVIENLFRANEIYVSNNDTVSYEKRLFYQREAITDIKILSYISMLSYENKCILFKQYEHISMLIKDSQNLIGAWIKSDKRRLFPNGN